MATYREEKRTISRTSMTIRVISLLFRVRNPRSMIPAIRQLELRRVRLTTRHCWSGTTMDLPTSVPVASRIWEISSPDTPPEFWGSRTPSDRKRISPFWSMMHMTPLRRPWRIFWVMASSRMSAATMPLTRPEALSITGCPTVMNRSLMELRTMKLPSWGGNQMASRLLAMVRYQAVSRMSPDLKE